MRPTFIILCTLSVLQLGCNHPTVAEHSLTYHAETFRADIDSLIDKKHYSAAVAYLNSADPNRQADYDQRGYLAVGEDAVILPGIPDRFGSYNPAIDWIFPGTQDAVEDQDWQKAATHFAEQYNHAREGK